MLLSFAAHGCLLAALAQAGRTTQLPGKTVTVEFALGRPVEGTALPELESPAIERREEVFSESETDPADGPRELEQEEMFAEAENTVPPALETNATIDAFDARDALAMIATLARLMPGGDSSDHEKPRASSLAIESAPAAEPSASSPGIERGADILELAAPVYPRLSRRRGEEGTAVVQITIHASGAVGDVAIVQTSGHARLDAAALEAARAGTYRPARQGGKPAASRLLVPFEFRLR